MSSGLALAPIDAPTLCFDIRTKLILPPNTGLSGSPPFAPHSVILTLLFCAVLFLLGQLLAIADITPLLSIRTAYGITLPLVILSSVPLAVIFDFLPLVPPPFSLNPPSPLMSSTLIKIAS